MSALLLLAVYLPEVAFDCDCIQVVLLLLLFIHPVCTLNRV